MLWQRRSSKAGNAGVERGMSPFNVARRGREIGVELSPGVRRAREELGERL